MLSLTEIGLDVQVQVEPDCVSDVRLPACSPKLASAQVPPPSDGSVIPDAVTITVHVVPVETKLVMLVAPSEFEHAGPPFGSGTTTTFPT